MPAFVAAVGALPAVGVVSSGGGAAAVGALPAVGVVSSGGGAAAMVPVLMVQPESLVGVLFP